MMMRFEAHGMIWDFDLKGECCIWKREAATVFWSPPGKKL